MAHKKTPEGIQDPTQRDSSQREYATPTTSRHVRGWVTRELQPHGNGPLWDWTLHAACSTVYEYTKTGSAVFVRSTNLYHGVQACGCPFPGPGAIDRWMDDEGKQLYSARLLRTSALVPGPCCHVGARYLAWLARANSHVSCYVSVRSTWAKKREGGRQIPCHVSSWTTP